MALEQHSHNQQPSLLHLNFLSLHQLKETGSNPYNFFQEPEAGQFPVEHLWIGPKPHPQPRSQANPSLTPLPKDPPGLLICYKHDCEELTIETACKVGEGEIWLEGLIDVVGKLSNW